MPLIAWTESWITPIRPLWLKTALASGFLVSTLAGFFLAIQLSIQTFSSLLLFFVISLLYFRVKKLPFVKGVLVAVVWVWAGVALPFANHHWFAWQFWTMRISLPVVMLIACNVILCDFKDIKSDHVNGVKSLPTMLGSRRTMWILSLSLAIAAMISFRENRMGLVISSALLFLLTQFPPSLVIGCPRSLDRGRGAYDSRGVDRITFDLVIVR